MRIFIAGVMQGSRIELSITAQTYREEIADIIQAHLPEVEILDPNRIHPDSVSYDRERAKRTFVEMSELAAQVDALVAYVPEASMGTAVEMWQAYRAGIPVYTISPLAENWVVFTLSREVFPDMAAFAMFVAENGLDSE